MGVGQTYVSARVVEAIACGSFVAHGCTHGGAPTNHYQPSPQATNCRNALRAVLFCGREMFRR